VKPITTGEGGMVTTNSDELAARLRRFRSHGIVRKPELGEWFYEISEVGFNYRLTDIQAALGLSQAQKLEQFTILRNQIASRYRDSMGHLSIELPPSAAKGFRHSYHLFPVLVPRRSEIFSTLRSKGIGVQVHYVPIHRHPLSRNVHRIGDLSAADKIYSSILSLPIFPNLSEEDLDFTIEVLTQHLER
jgi:perosamine synthetase